MDIHVAETGTIARLAPLDGDCCTVTGDHGQEVPISGKGGWSLTLIGEDQDRIEEHALFRPAGGSEEGDVPTAELAAWVRMTLMRAGGSGGLNRG